MPSPSSIDNFILIENDFRDKLTNIFAFSGNYTKNNPNAAALYRQVLGKLEIIKNSVNNVVENELTYLADLLKTITNELPSLERPNSQWRNLDEEEWFELLKTLTGLHDYINKSWVKLFTETDRYDSIIQILNSELNKLKEKGKEDAETISDLKNRMEIELNEFEDRYRNTFANVEILTQEQIFTQEAKINKRDSWIWAIIVLILTGCLLLICKSFIDNCWINLHCLYSKEYIANSHGRGNWKTLFYYELFRPAAMRLFIISIIVLLIKFSMKNYNALMHNKTINMHKANSLAAVLRIINSLDESTRSTLMESAGKEIFMHQKTGYLNKEETKIDLNVFEKIMSIIQKKE